MRRRATAATTTSSWRSPMRWPACAGAAPTRSWRSAASRAARNQPGRRCCAAWSIRGIRGYAACRVTSGTWWLRRAISTCWRSTTYPACGRGSRTTYAVSPPGPGSACASSTPTPKSLCSPAPGRSSSTASRRSSSGRTSPSARSFAVCEPISRKNRKSEEEVWASFEAAHASVLGALLDAVSTGLKRFPEIRPPDLPRMADFAHWAISCEPALWKDGDFLRAYNANILAAVESVLEASPVAVAVRELMANLAKALEKKWSGTASDLLALLTDLVTERIAKSDDWPRNGRALSGRLRRAASFLRRVGIDVVFRQEGHAKTRLITITGSTPPASEDVKVGKFASAPSAPSASGCRMRTVRTVRTQKNGPARLRKGYVNKRGPRMRTTTSRARYERSEVVSIIVRARREGVTLYRQGRRQARLEGRPKAVRRASGRPERTQGGNPRAASSSRPAPVSPAVAKAKADSRAAAGARLPSLPRRPGRR